MGLIVNFSDFENISASALSTSDYLVGYTGNPNRETRITIGDFVNFIESISGNDLYVVLYANSAKWDSTYSSLNQLSSSNVLVFSNSGRWESNYVTVINNSAFWTTAYNTVQTLTGNFINVSSNNFVINSSNKNLYNKKFINLFHDDTSVVTVNANVGLGFSCKLFNNSTHYVILSGAPGVNYNAKGSFLNDQYGLVNLETDGIYVYGYGDLESGIGPAYPDAILTNEDAFLLQENDSLLLY